MLAAIWVPIVAYRRPEASDCRVAVISGGGSGHEPAHAGFVGRGLLDAAVCGSIFASPNMKQIRRALDLVIRERGCVMTDHTIYLLAAAVRFLIHALSLSGLVVAMNYSGDALHFGLAASQHQAAKVTNNDVRVLLVGDDVSVGRAQGGIVGRRYAKSEDEALSSVSLRSLTTCHYRYYMKGVWPVLSLSIKSRLRWLPRESP
jgi:hypothetical protein